MVEFPQPEGSGHSGGYLPQHKRHQNLDSLGSADCWPEFPHSQAADRLFLLLLEAKPLQVSWLMVFCLSPAVGQRPARPDARVSGRSSLVSGSCQQEFRELLCCSRELWGFILAPDQAALYPLPDTWSFPPHMAMAALHYMCNLGQMSWLLWAPVSQSIKWGIRFHFSRLTCRKWLEYPV